MTQKQKIKCFKNNSLNFANFQFTQKINNFFTQIYYKNWKKKTNTKTEKKNNIHKKSKKKNKTKCEKKNSHKPNKPFCYYNQKQISKILENEWMP